MGSEMCIRDSTYIDDFGVGNSYLYLVEIERNVDSQNTDLWIQIRKGTEFAGLQAEFSTPTSMSTGQSYGNVESHGFDYTSQDEQVNNDFDLKHINFEFEIDKDFLGKV